MLYSNKEIIISDTILDDKQELLETLDVGTRLERLMAAIENEIDALGVLYGYGSRKELTQAGAHHLCSSPNQIYKWIHS